MCLIYTGRQTWSICEREQQMKVNTLFGYALAIVILIGGFEARPNTDRASQENSISGSVPREQPAPTTDDLTWAIELGDIVRAKSLITDGVDING